ILLRQKQKKLIMLPSETMIWQPEFTDKTLSRKPGAVQAYLRHILSVLPEWPSNRVDELLPWNVVLTNK
ncbi:transposase domain-containing protein, partial [Escherichia coli]|uniref:transposase domain-containing protein n=1 Tax=Escherichia coli TaxID=562 RepID=UPI00208DEB0C